MRASVINWLYLNILTLLRVVEQHCFVIITRHVAYNNVHDEESNQTSNIICLLNIDRQQNIETERTIN